MSAIARFRFLEALVIRLIIYFYSRLLKLAANLALLALLVLSNILISNKGLRIRS